MSNVMELSLRGASNLEKLMRAVLLDSENKVPSERLRIVGAVADGAIIEQGSNSNGDWIRFANGLQICMSTIELTGIDVPEIQQVWGSNQYVPPASFLNSAFNLYVSTAYGRNLDANLNLYLAIAYTSSGVLSVWNTGRSPSNVHPGGAVRGVGSQIYNVTSATIRVVAVGKWK